jgi:hypothetical protein
MTQVLHFNHEDFLTTLKIDVLPLLSNTGLWMAKRFASRSKMEGDADGRKRATTVAEIIEKVMDDEGKETLQDERKYNFLNKFGPKKLPD